MQLPDEIDEVNRVTLRPGDIVVLRSSRSMTPQLSDEIEERAKALFGDYQVVVLGPGMDLEVVRPEAGDR